MNQNGNKRLAIRIGLILIMLLSSVSMTMAQPDVIYSIEIDGEITPAMAAFLVDRLDEAERVGAAGVMIQIRTLGGRVDSALAMRDAMVESIIPVAVYINARAISAGALISIAAETIIMAPGSHIGAAEPIPNDPKSVAFVSGEFRTTAERTGRDPNVAVAMVDASREIEGLVVAGEILDMTASEAMEIGFIDHMARNRREAFEVMGWSDAQILEQTMDFRYRIAQFLTGYEVASILLSLGMIGIIAEFFTQGFGVPGIVGISCLALYFISGFLAGYTELWAVLLFMAGIILLLVEITAPGFGIFGISGLVAILVSIVFSAPTFERGLGSLFISLASTIVMIPIFFRLFGKTNLIRRFVLSTAETVDSGYTHADRKDDLFDKMGMALTVLRPSGSIEIDGKKVDAVAEGSYISKGAKVKVIRVEGSKVIVAEQKSEDT